MAQRTPQRKTVGIDRGLFLIRYAAAEDKTRPPSVTVSTEADAEQSISFLLHPDHRDAILWHPETALVVRATAPGTLRIEVLPSQANGSTVATVRIEPISQGQAPAPPATRSDRILDAKDFRITGHVAGIGDVVVGGNEWIAGPLAPSRIEGILIDWPSKPDGLEFRYSVKTANRQGVPNRMTSLGSFAGSRGKSLALVGVVFEISGSPAADLGLTAEAIFLGSPVKRATGKRLTLTGPTGREPLVGLRLAPAGMTAEARAQSPTTKQSQPPGRVRVFRSRAKQDQSS